MSEFSGPFAKLERMTLHDVGEATGGVFNFLRKRYDCKWAILKR
jgi:hypothetical protein